MRPLLQWVVVGVDGWWVNSSVGALVLLCSFCMQLCVFGVCVYTETAFSQGSSRSGLVNGSFSLITLKCCVASWELCELFS